MDTRPVHVQEMIIGNPNNMVKDRSPLWKNFRRNNFERPFMHGVVGPQWQVPLAEDNRGFKHISSPMPKPEVVRRIQPSDLPPVTYSPTSFDLPMRKDVVQVDIPSATIRTTEENIDPRFPAKKPVAKVTGTLYHGTGSVDPAVVHGLTSFLQKKSKSRKRLNAAKIKKQSHLHRVEGIAAAKAAEAKSHNMLYSVVNEPAGSNKMILGVELLNNYEQPDLRIHENNLTLKRRIEGVRNTPAGVRAAHTFRKLP